MTRDQIVEFDKLCSDLAVYPGYQEDIEKMSFRFLTKLLDRLKDAEAKLGRLEALEIKVLKLEEIEKYIDSTKVCLREKR